MNRVINIGCTCYNNFYFPFSKDEVVSLYVTYAQSNKTLKKTLDDCTFENKYIKVPLSQKETLLFDAETIVKIQIRVKLSSGVVTKSNIMYSYCDELLKREVI